MRASGGAAAAHSGQLPPSAVERHLDRGWRLPVDACDVGDRVSLDVEQVDGAAYGAAEPKDRVVRHLETALSVDGLLDVQVLSQQGFRNLVEDIGSLAVPPPPPIDDGVSDHFPHERVGAIDVVAFAERFQGAEAGLLLQVGIASSVDGAHRSPDLGQSVRGTLPRIRIESLRDLFCGVIGCTGHDKDNNRWRK